MTVLARVLVRRSVYYDVGSMAGAEQMPELDVHTGAAGDLWRNTLSAIPTIYGRLAYLSTLRDTNTGRYEHHGLALLFGPEETHRALRSSHVRCFREWMTFDLEQQTADLHLYLASLGGDWGDVVRAWSESVAWRNLIPGAIRGAERKQFLAEVGVLMSLLRTRYGASCPDPDA